MDRSETKVFLGELSPKDFLDRDTNGLRLGGEAYPIVLSFLLERLEVKECQVDLSKAWAMSWALWESLQASKLL